MHCKSTGSLVKLKQFLEKTPETTYFRDLSFISKENGDAIIKIRLTGIYVWDGQRKIDMAMFLFYFLI